MKSLEGYRKDAQEHFRFSYPLETSIKQFNASCRLVLKREWRKISADIDIAYFDSKLNISKTLIMHPLPKVAYFIAPTFYDDIYQHTVDVLMTSLIVMGWEISVFWFWAQFFRFD